MSIVRGNSYRHAPGPVRLHRLAWFLVAALVATGTGLAAEEPRAEGNGERERAGGIRLDRERLATRVSLEMESFSTFQQAAGPWQGLDGHVLFDELTGTVQRRAESVTRRFLRDHLLGAIRLDRGIDRLRNEIRGDRAGRDGPDFHFGFHHMLPEVGMRYRFGAGSLRLSLGAEGDVGIRFAADHLDRSDIAIAFDGDQTYRVRARLSF